MKLISKIILSLTAFLVTSTYCSEIVIKPGSEIIIRPATENDLPAIFNLSHIGYETDFKPLWTENYAQLTPSHQTISEFVKEKEDNNNDAIKDFIIRQANKEEYCVLVAYIVEPGPYLMQSIKKESLAGYCRFKKENATNMYINHILIDPLFRKKGIAKILTHKAFITWNTVTQCKFRALTHYNFINELYKKHNCQLTDTISLDPITGKIITDPNAQKTHNEYSYTIKK